MNHPTGILRDFIEGYSYSNMSKEILFSIDPTSLRDYNQIVSEAKEALSTSSIDKIEDVLFVSTKDDVDTLVLMTMLRLINIAHHRNYVVVVNEVIRYIPSTNCSNSSTINKKVSIAYRKLQSKLKDREFNNRMESIIDYTILKHSQM